MPGRASRRSARAEGSIGGPAGICCELPTMCRRRGGPTDRDAAAHAGGETMGTLKRIWSEHKIATLVGGAIALIAIAGVAGYLILKRPADVSNPDAAFEAADQGKELLGTANWPLYGLNPERTRYLPAKGVEPPFRVAWRFNGRKLLEYSPVLARRPALRDQQQRRGVRAQDPHGQGPLAARDREPQRVLPRLPRQVALLREPRAGPGPRRQREDRKHALEARAAGPHRVLARDRQGPPDRRLRVRQALRARPAHRQDDLGGGSAAAR